VIIKRPVLVAVSAHGSASERNCLPASTIYLTIANRPKGLCLLELLIQIWLHLFVGHSFSGYLSPVDRHWPAFGGCTCGETALEAGV
jgi:hypothetical protein